jgi:hypothetical protein
MHEDYDDIRSKIAQAPQWFDEYAVPRYCTFEPKRCADIYCDEAVLAEITCQGCGAEFRVAFSQGSFDRFGRDGRRLADDIRARELHYGDPPNIRCCAAGPTMNSEPRRVLQYWHTHHKEYVGENGIVTDMAYFDWRRDPTLEIEIEPEWVSGGRAL